MRGFAHARTTLTDSYHRCPSLISQSPSCLFATICVGLIVGRIKCKRVFASLLPSKQKQSQKPQWHWKSRCVDPCTLLLLQHSNRLTFSVLQHLEAHSRSPGCCFKQVVWGRYLNSYSVLSTTGNGDRSFSIMSGTSYSAYANGRCCNRHFA